jgi:Pvc16 N-terminal domain
MADTAMVMGVSRTLQTLLADRVEPPPNVASVPVTISTPQADPNAAPAAEPTRLNLFLYRITENEHLKNQESPGRGQPGTYGHPPLCLNLHFLLTAYGSTDDNGFLNESRAHFVLGSAMRVLHDHAELTERVVTVRAPSGEPVLDPALLEQPEPVRLTLESLSLDDLTKVWTALTLPYRLSAAYEVRVARIESRRPRRVTRPVGEPPAAGPRVFVTTLRNPRITNLRVHRQDAAAGLESPFPYARIGDTLILGGHDLDGTDAHVRLGALPIPVAAPAAHRAEVVVPDADLPGGVPIPEERRLQPGPQPVSVLVGFPGLPGRPVASNRAVVMLVPRVATVKLDTTAVPRTLTASGTRLFRPDREGETLIGPVRVHRSAYQDATETKVTVPLPDTLPATAVRGLLSGPLAPFPSLGNQLDLDVKIGTDGPHTISLAGKPTTVPAAARLLQVALRDTAAAGPRFRGARVTATADDRLLIVPGELASAVVVADGSLAAALRLDQQAARPIQHGRLSGPLSPFPALTAAEPRLGVTIDADSATVTLPRRPVMLADAAALLQAGLRAHAAPGFATALVAVVGEQLLLVPGTDAALQVAAAAGADTTSPAELQLRVRYTVRVRVEGAESIDTTTVELP